MTVSCEEQFQNIYFYHPLPPLSRVVLAEVRRGVHQLFFFSRPRSSEEKDQGVGGSVPTRKAHGAV